MSRTTSPTGSFSVSARPDRLAKIPWTSIARSVGASCGLALVIVMPLWVLDSNSSAYLALAGVLPNVMMFCPLIATLFVVFGMKVPARNRLQFLGIWPLRPAKRIIWFIVTMTITPIVLVFASLGVSVLAGWAQRDVVNFSGVQAMLEQHLEDTELRPELLSQLDMMNITWMCNAIA